MKASKHSKLFSTENKLTGSVIDIDDILVCLVLALMSKKDILIASVSLLKVSVYCSAYR